MTKQNIAQWLVILVLLLQSCGGQVSAFGDGMRRGVDKEAGVVCWQMRDSGIHCMKISDTGLAK